MNMSSFIFNKPKDQITKMERNKAKVITLVLNSLCCFTHLGTVLWTWNARVSQ